MSGLLLEHGVGLLHVGLAREQRQKRIDDIAQARQLLQVLVCVGRIVPKSGFGRASLELGYLFLFSRDVKDAP